jgi:hypothetical protein
MKITEFNKPNLKVLGADIQLALDEVAKKHGLFSIKIKGGTFSSTCFGTRLEARTCDQLQDKNFIATQKSVFSMYGLPDNSVGRRFDSAGQTFEIHHFDTKKYKMPVIAMRVDNGKVTTHGYKFSVERVKRFLETQGA